MQHVDITEKLMMIDTVRQSFDMQEIADRRFMFSPASGTLILGDQYKGNKIVSNHLAEYRQANTNEPFDSFICGWVGTATHYPTGVIDFSPPFATYHEDLYKKALSALEMFNKNGAKAETVIHGIVGEWERPLSDLIAPGSLRKVWLQDVEPMTRDHHGFIYYKDKQVEHYSTPYAFAPEGKRDLTELRNRCEYLERNGLKISTGMVVWGWEKHRKAYEQEKQAKLDRVLTGNGITFSNITIYNKWNKYIEFYKPGISDWQELKNCPEFIELYTNYKREHGHEVYIQSYRYGGAGEAENPEAMNLIPSCFTYLKANGLLEKVKSQNFNIEPEREWEVDNDMDDEMEGEL